MRNVCSVGLNLYMLIKKLCIRRTFENVYKTLNLHQVNCFADDNSKMIIKNEQ